MKSPGRGSVLKARFYLRLLRVCIKVYKTDDETKGGLFEDSLVKSVQLLHRL